MDESTLDSRLKNKPTKIGVGVLLHHGFRFNHPNADGTARANIVQSQNESVYGLVYEVAVEDRDFFLRSEPGYKFIQKEILTKTGKIQAYTFVSEKTKGGIFPQESYWKVIVKGGKDNGLPNGYLAQIINRVGKV